MTKHTQGPWKVRKCTRCRVWELTGLKNEEILCSHYMGDEMDGDFYGAVSNEADARLIAVAPELLDALIGILDAAENFYIEGAVNPDKCKDIQAARAAIAKANGETQ